VLRPGRAGERFAERLRDPLKRWKLSPIDVEARRHYDDLHHARARPCSRPRTRQHAPWTLVDFNSQKRGRLALIRDLLGRLPDTKVPPAKITFEPLAGKPRKERFGMLKPI
jgi:polyphosphate kinase 2 (PPK2 family)